MFFLFAGDNRHPGNEAQKPIMSFDTEVEARTALSDATNYKGQHDWAYISTDRDGKTGIIERSVRKV